MAVGPPSPHWSSLVTTLTLRDQLDCAHAVFCAPHGTVTQLARERDSSRQAIYRLAHATAHAVQGDPQDDARREDKDRLIDALRAEIEQLRQCLQGAIVLDEDARFASTAQANSVPLPAATALLASLPPPPAPGTAPQPLPGVSRASLGRQAHEAGRRAGPVLKVLDEFARPCAEQALGDEMFSGRKPILMQPADKTAKDSSGRR